MNENNEISKSTENESSNINFASEVLSALKESNQRLWTAIFAIMGCWLVTIGVFVWYIFQYDYSTTYEANGYYALADADGNIFAQDVTPELWSKFIEWSEANGYGKSDENPN